MGERQIACHIILGLIAIGLMMVGNLLYFKYGGDEKAYVFTVPAFLFAIFAAAFATIFIVFKAGDLANFLAMVFAFALALALCNLTVNFKNRILYYGLSVTFYVLMGVALFTW
ncbi:MAG: hypothetical protein WDZ85_03895 [Candidatus Paceibacterota bacterium]